jgi:hypothetical protein
MPKFFGTQKRFRRRQVRKAVWIVFSTFAALAMVATTVAPNIVSSFRQ